MQKREHPARLYNLARNINRATPVKQDNFVLIYSIMAFLVFGGLFLLK